MCVGNSVSYISEVSYTFPSVISAMQLKLQLILLLVTGVLDSLVIPTIWHFQRISYGNQSFQCSKLMITKVEIVLCKVVELFTVHCYDFHLMFSYFI